MRRAYLLLLAVSLSAPFLACERKPLLDEGVDVAVSLVDAPEDGTYRAVAYDGTTRRQSGSAFLPADGGLVAVPAGPCDMIIHTFGCEAAVLEDEASFDAVTVTTHRADAATQAAWTAALTAPPVNTVDDAAMLEERTALVSRAVHWSPDAMYAAVLTDLDIPRRTEDETFSVLASLRPVAEAVTVELTDVIGLEHLSSAVAFMTGAAPGLRLADWSPCGTDVVLSLRLYRRGTSLVGAVPAFGWCEDALRRILVLATDRAGKSYVYEYDPSALLPGSTYVALPSQMEIPEPEEAGGGGLQPALEDWNMTIVPVHL